MVHKALLKCFIAVVALAVSGVARAATIDFVSVGNPGNAADSTGYGAVDYAYEIGKYEVTAGQYTEFLNAVAGTDPHGLYNPSMWSHTFGCKIERINSSGSYGYSVASAYENRPVNLVSFWDAARFANWLHNGGESGDTETGAYVNIGNSATFARQPGALFFIPTEDEWYKAAYHKNGATDDYFEYPTGSDSVPSKYLNQGGNNATFYASGYTIGFPHYRTEAGAHKNSESPYDTFDQGGNVQEWNETVIGSNRGLRGGAFVYNGSILSASIRGSSSPATELTTLGFRVATIPEPGSLAMLAGLAVMGLVWWRRRK